MKNQLPNLTEQEKIDFLSSPYKEYAKNVKSEKRFILKLLGALLLAPPVAGLMLTLANHGLFLGALSLGYGIVVPMSAILIGAMFYTNLSVAHKDFKELSDGKISYRQYKKLVKTGELEKWQQELNSKNIVIEEYKSNKISINSKEFAEKVIGVIQENNRNNSMEK